MSQRAKAAAPRITQAEVEAVQAQIAARVLPRAAITNTGSAPTSPRQSRLGGVPFAQPDGKDWPMSCETEMPMLFLAQINFAELPAIEGFPTSGLLQLFGSIDETGCVMTLDEPGDFDLRWIESPKGEGQLPIPSALLGLKNRTLSRDAIAQGRALTFKADDMAPTLDNWPMSNACADWGDRLAENEAVAQSIKALEFDADQASGNPIVHWLGGQIDCIQGDPREAVEWQRFDRVVLHLGFDDDLCIGDAGMLNLMMSQQDLRNRAFDKARCNWDCS